jgi:hypothetical protein
LYGALACGLAWAAALLTVGRGGAFWSQSEALARAADTVYVPVCIPVLALAALRAVPSVDLRSLSSAIIFGPLTLLRWPVIVAGAARALAAGGLHSALAAFLLAAMLGADAVLRRLTPDPIG